MRARLLAQLAARAGGWAPGAGTRQQRERGRAPRQAQGAPSARRSPPLPPSPSLPFWKGGPRRDAQSGLRSSAAGRASPTWCGARRGWRGRRGNRGAFFKVGGGGGGLPSSSPGGSGVRAGQWGAGRRAEPCGRRLKKLVAGRPAGTDLRRQRRRQTGWGRATALQPRVPERLQRSGHRPGAPPRCALLRARPRCWT